MADVLAIRARAREKYIIYVLPYVALVKQKQEYLRKLFQSENVCVSAFCGEEGRYYPRPESDDERLDIAVCTIEKVPKLS